MTETSAYNHEALLDDARIGNQPSEHYLEVVDMLDNVVRECMYVSRGYSGIRSPTPRHYYASVLFTALITRGVSLAQLMPFTPWAEKQIEHWDYASVAGIVRTIMELRIAFYYLCTEKCSEDEWQCRWNIFNLHDCVSRARLFEAMGDTEQVQAFAAHADELRGRLVSNIYFQSLAPGAQRKLLHGQTAYLLPLEEIAERAGVERSTFRWLYLMFSSHVHGLPMSFYRIGQGAEERGRGLPSPIEEGYTSLCLSLASALLISTRDEVHELFAEFKQEAEEKILRESTMENTPDVPNASDGMAVGQTLVLVETDDVVIEVTRTSEDAVESVYRHKLTNDVILRRIDSDQDGVTLTQFDAVFWNVLVNNKPATESQLHALETEPWAFKADHQSRTLSIKIGS